MFFACLIIIIINFTQIAFTPLATAPWHAFTIYPFFTVMISCSTVLCYEELRHSKPLTTALISLISLLVVLKISQTLIYSHDFKKKSVETTNIHWSPQIKDLANYTQTINNKTIVFIDWGIHNQIQTFDPIKGKYIDYCFSFSSEQSDEKLLGFYNCHLKEKKCLFVTHSKKYQLIKDAENNFFRMMHLAHQKPEVIKRITGTQSDLFVVYTLK